MTLEAFIKLGRDQGASDVHLEGGLPVALRVRGALRTLGEPVPAAQLAEIARELFDDDAWREFATRHSADLSRTILGVRCRINVLRTARGVGLAIRLLASFQASLKKLNLHPDLGKLMAHEHGLVLVSGPTGSGKTTTLAALIQELNVAEPRHIVTIESPIEYTIPPQRAFIRQREVGRDTPSFEQALLDALREDPDVLMVGEMREPATMRLTLNASETGHLVLATVHSSSCTEALQRLVSAFAPETQPSVCAQLADCLVAVICQRLVYRPALRIAVPECEILLGTTAVRAVIRQGQLAKLQTALETGGQEGSWTFARYREWLDRRTDLHVPSSEPEVAATPEPERPMERRAPAPAPRRAPVMKAPPPARPAKSEDVLVLSADEADPATILAELEKRRR